MSGLTKEQRQKRQSDCARKRSYYDEYSAKRTGQQVYHCPVCKNWHRFGPYVSLANPVLPRNFRLPK